MKAFTHAMKYLGHLDAEAVARLVAAAADVALVIDDAGVIRDMSFHSEELARDLGGQAAWRGRRWSEVVSPDSRQKVAAMLRDAHAGTAARWRHVNHPFGAEGQLPVLYAVTPFGDRGEIMAFGRDLRAVSELQQRLVDAQQALEQDYARLRHAETRYRLLFQSSAEPILILDAATLKVAEANPAAQALFGDAGRRLVGRGIGPAFDRAGGDAVQSLLQTVRVSGRGDTVRARLAGAQMEAAVSATLFREGGSALLLLRIDAAGGAPSAEAARAGHPFLELMQAVPDGFVAIGADGRILAANAAFLDLAQLASEDQARGEHLDRWLGREGLNVDVLIANLRQRGTVRLFATVMRGEHGAATDVEISGAAITVAGRAGYGLAIRNVARRPGAAQPGLPQHTADQLTELIGRVPLKELVRRSTDVIERLCIETALKLTDDNRAAAAETLGLSRQSFYVKLRRYGLGDLGADDGEAE